MGSWLTEQDLRDSRMDSTGWPSMDAPSMTDLTLNVAFLNDIKLDTEQPQRIIGQLETSLSSSALVQPAELVSLLARLRDELEVYFSLEEFYGYFRSAKTSHSQVSQRAEHLRSQHETIFLDVCELVDLAESILYRESPSSQSLPAIVAGFRSLVQDFNNHEQQEEELMMKLCNDEIGVGD